MLREAYHVLEVNFWGANEEGNLVWTGRTADTAPGLSHQPHVILNQARVNGLLLDAMNRFNAQSVDYGYDVKGVQVDSGIAQDSNAYPVTVVTEKDGAEVNFKAKYVLVSVSQIIQNINSHPHRLVMEHIAPFADLLVTR
jgi:phenol 2-monooxygenase